MPRFLSSLTEKAQSALDKSGLAAHLPTTHTQQAQQPINPNNPAYSQGADAPDGRSTRPHMIETLTHQFKALHAQYAPQGPPEVRKLQVQITNAKGVSLDYDGIGRDIKAQAKDFYLWGQEQADDIKDVSDRLAYLNFIHGTLASNLSAKLDAARAPLKELRNSEATIGPRRTQRAQLQQQIDRLKLDGGRTTAADAHRKIVELEAQLNKHMQDDEPLEREAAQLHRKAIAESERLKWEALREFGEKLVLLSQASEQLVSQMPSRSPTKEAPYTGQQNTASIRSSVQMALDQWSPGKITLTPLAPHHIADTRSFGESHATELSRVNSVSSPLPDQTHGAPIVTEAESQVRPQPTAASSSSSGFQPPAGATQSYYTPASAHSTKPVGATGYAPPSGPPPGHHSSTSSHPAGSPPLNPAVLNNNPAPIPAVSHHISGASGALPHTSLPHTISPVAAHHEQPASAAVGSSESPAGAADPSLTTAITPTVAETGMPISAGPGGPGPASGNLSKAPQGPPPGAADPSIPGYNPGGFKQEVGHESAEEEKRRLAREEREMYLAQVVGASGSGGPQQEKQESAEEEKKRLEKEERERLFRSDTIRKDGDGGPPPYTG